MRILHAGRNSANQALQLVRALRALGHGSEMWEFGPDRFGYNPDRTVDLSSRDPAIFWDLMQEALERFDVMHFHAGRSFFPGEWGGVPIHWDLPVLRILGKKVFHTFHGSDCRVKRQHLEMNPWSYYRFSDIAADDDKTEKDIRIWQTYANALFVTAVDNLAFVPSAVVTPRLVDLSLIPSIDPSQRDAPVIAHVPSHRGTKGTHFIEQGMEALRDEGIRFDFRLVEDVAHPEALAAIRDADVVIDNVITGDYELVSIETMASSRVAVANLQPGAERQWPDAPVYNVDPDSFVERMRALIMDPEHRRALAARGRSYVEEHHQASSVARQLLTFYEAPDAPLPARTHPDWASLQHALRLERTEFRVYQLERELARARLGGRPSGPARPGGVGGRVAARARAVGRKLPPRLRRRLQTARDAVLRARRGAPRQ